MEVSARLDLPYLSPQQSQKHVTVNEGLRRLDAIVQLGVVSATTSAEPGSPADGDLYILPAGKAGTDWGAMTDLAVAYYVDGAWSQLTPREGWRAYVADTDRLLVYDGAAWDEIVQASQVRERVTANRTYYVRSDGSDANTGLADTAGGAFLTLQKAWNTIAGLDLSTFAATIELGTATFTGGLVVDKVPLGGSGVTINGDGAASTILSTASRGIHVTAPGAVITLTNFKIETSGSSNNNCLEVAAHSKVYLGGGMEFGASVGRHIRVTGFGYVFAVGNWAISGGALSHLATGPTGLFEAYARTVTITGTPAFSTAFVDTQDASPQLWYQMTFSGSATGKRYNAVRNGIINSFGGGASYFPGDVAGTTATGGVYA